jgi:hypothetical protein
MQPAAVGAALDGSAITAKVSDFGLSLALQVRARVGVVTMN